MRTPAEPGALTFATPSPPSARHLWRGREPIYGALPCAGVESTLQIQSPCPCQQGGNPGSLNRHRGGRRAQGGGGGLKTRPWRLIKYQLQITMNVDPGDAGNADFRHPLPTLQPATYGGRGRPICSALPCAGVNETMIVKALIHASKAVIQVPSTAIRGGWRAQGGGGGPKARPWHLIKYRLQITKNVDPGVAGSIHVRHPLPTLRPPLMAWEGADLQRLARTRSRLTAPVFNALIHASQAVIQVPSTAIRGGRRAQGGGGGPKARPWRRINHQLQITINKDPGYAGSANVRHPLPTLQPATYGVGGSRSSAPWLGQNS